jgi:hypothetical protein
MTFFKKTIGGPLLAIALFVPAVLGAAKAIDAFSHSVLAVKPFSLDENLKQIDDLNKKLDELTKRKSTDCRVTLAQYQNLQIGMSYSQVVTTLGCNGTETVKSEISGYTGAIYSWQGSGSLGANMIAQFHNDSLIVRAQFGLR